MALQIVIHTFRMIFGNIGQALRVSIGPYLILIVAILVMFAAFGLPITNAANPAEMMISPTAGLIPFIMLPLVLFVTSWVAVSWHRFILLEEYSGILPDVSGRPIWPYAGKAILLGLILMLVAIPLFFVLGLIMAPFLSAPSAGLPLVGTIVFGLASVLLSFLSLRLGVSLVGTALGKPLRFSDAWAATGKISGVILNVSLLLVVINILPNAIIAPLTLALPIIGTVLQLALTWLTMMLSVSLLTTLYGHVIENRPLIS